MLLSLQLEPQVKSAPVACVYILLSCSEVEFVTQEESK